MIDENSIWYCLIDNFLDKVMEFILKLAPSLYVSFILNVHNHLQLTIVSLVFFSNFDIHIATHCTYIYTF